MAKTATGIATQVASGFASFVVDAMRVTFPKGKVAEANPDRFATVTGKAIYPVRGYDAEGNPVLGPAQSAPAKYITIEQASDAGFVLDIPAGTLTIPVKARGRVPSASVTQDELAARLAALRG